MSEDWGDGVPDVREKGVSFVWVIDEGVRARVLEWGAYYVKAAYTINGIDYEAILLNDEYILMEEYEPVDGEDEE